MLLKENKMKLRIVLAIVMMVAFAGLASADLVFNSGFEDGSTTNRPYWTHFGGDNNDPRIEDYANHSGTNGLAYRGWTAGGGIYQDIAASGASNYVMTFYAYRDDIFSSGYNTEVKLEFYDGSPTPVNLLLAVTNNLSTTVSSWTNLSLNALSPAGTTWVRPVLSYSGTAGTDGALKLDDLNLTSTMIPEPTTVSLIGVSLISLLALRRRARG
jgi:hypothetical protein